MLSGASDLADFTGSQGGAYPVGGVVGDHAGDLFGVTWTGGDHNAGTLFEIPVGASSPVTLHAFTGGTDGSAPVGPLLIDDLGDLFGVTTGGGTSGTVFELPAGATDLTTWAATLPGVPNGGIVVDGAGDLFGTTRTGDDAPTGSGTAFEVSASPGHPVRDLGVTGVGAGGLAMAPDGDLYGTAEHGGPAGNGTFFVVAPDGGAYDAVSTRVTFDAGGGPIYAPVLGVDGTAFCVTRANTIVAVGPGHSYAVTDARGGIGPGYGDAGPLAITLGGDLYFTTTASPGNGPAQVHEWGGTALVSSYDQSLFDAHGETVDGPLWVGVDGRLYGTSTTGGPAGLGAVVVTPAPGPLAGTTLTLTASTPTTTGDPVKFVATLSPATPGALVTIEDLNPAGGVSNAFSVPLDAGGTVEWQRTLGLGADDARGVAHEAVIYGGTPYYGDSRSAVVGVAVVAKRVPTTVTLTSTLPAGATVAPGAAVHFTVTVTPATVLPTAAPTGTVRINSAYSARLGPDGTAQITAIMLPSASGVTLFAAAYDGAGAYDYAASDPVAVTVATPALAALPAATGLPTTLVNDAESSGLAKLRIQSTAANRERGRATLVLYLSTDDALDSQDFEVARAFPSVSLKPGGTVVASVKYRIRFPDDPPATYHVLAQVTDAAGATNVTELSTLVDGVLRHDQLQATAVGVPSARNPSGVTLVLKNLGNIDEVGRLQIHIRVGNATAMSEVLKSIQPDVKLRVGKTIRIPLPRVRIGAGDIPDGVYAPLVSISIDDSDYSTVATTNVTLVLES